ncbi:MAG: 5'-nucleotidase [Chitinophagaceae bacterium]|jgi:2',3'-cyclic-nucleotide 2'-phosphodiesterase (5'-nucleotidase family)
MYSQSAFSQNKALYNCFTGMNVYEIKPDKQAFFDTAVSELLSLYNDNLKIKMEEMVIENDVPLSKSLPESTLGNWVTDAALHIAGKNRRIDACIINYGSIGKDYIAPGPVRRKDFYELIPYENKLVLINVSGSLLKTICDSIAQINGIPVAGISFVIDSGKATKIKVKNQEVNDYLLYSILVNDYLLSNRTFAPLIGKMNYQSTGISLRNALFQYAEYLKNNGLKITSNLENRITYEE